MYHYWQDYDVRFDVSSNQLQMAPGEKILERIDRVEDTKGNGGDPGCLLVTNLRLIWHSLKSPKLNLSYGTLTSIDSQNINSRLKGPAEALHLLTKTPNGKFEFLFTALDPLQVNLKSILGEIHRSYISSRPFRELRLRNHVIQGKQLRALPLEHICNRIEGVWNLSSNQGNLGCFILTNVRLIWFATMNEYFNMSLPYIQIAEIGVRESKFGQVLVIETVESGGNYILGFRIDPMARLKQTVLEIHSLYSTQIRNPELGVEWTSTITCDGNKPTNAKEEAEDEGQLGQCFANYWIENNGAGGDGQPPEFNRELGLAIEKLPEGVDMNSLWQIIM